MIGDLNVCIMYEMYPFLAEKLTPIRNWQLVILSCYVVAVLSSILHVISFVTEFAFLPLKICPTFSVGDIV